ncbi:MAG: type II secretion system protein [Verrucomicrobiota bacterium]
MILSAQPIRRGFLLLEMVLALGVFGIAATGFAVALKRMAQAAQLAQSELRITRILDSALEETLSLPVLEEGETNASVGDTGIELDTTISLLEDLETEEGQPLAEMYRIEILARWYENGAWQERAVDTWRYGRMYQPQ